MQPLLGEGARLVLCLVLAALSMSGLVEAHFGAGGSYSDSLFPETQAEAAAGRRLRPVLRTLEALTAEELAEAAGVLLMAHPVLGRDALILQAGRPLPPGLTGARQQQREATRAAALQALRSDMALGSEQEQPWLRRLEWHLELGTGPELRPDTSQDLRAASMVVAAELDLVHLAPSLLPFLEHSPLGLVELSARASLRTFLGRWVLDGESAGPLPTEMGPEALAVRAAFVQASDTARELRLRLLEMDPKVAQELFDGPDPELRILAAQRLLRAIGAQEQGRDEVAASLLDRVAVEPEAKALHAVLSALIELAQAAGPEAPISASLRLALHKRLADATPYLAPVLIAALERLPAAQAAQGAPSEVLVDDVQLASKVLVKLLSRGAPVDGDDLILAQNVWSRLAERAGARGEEDFLQGSASLVRDLLGEGEESDAVRFAVVAALGRLSPGPAELATCLDLLEAGALPSALRVAVYSLTEKALLAPGESVGAESRGRLLTCLGTDLVAGDAELRRRSVRFLGTDPLLVEARSQRSTGNAQLVEALLTAAVGETLVDLQTAMIQLVERQLRGQPGADALDQFLQRAGVGDLRRAERERSVALGELVLTLSGSDGKQRMRAARWMAVLPGPLAEGATEAPAALAMRLDSALHIVAGLEQAQVAGFDLEDHRQVLRWSAELLRGQSRLAFGETAGWLAAALLERHLPALTSETESAEWSLLEARLRVAREGAEQQRGVILAAFARALPGEGTTARLKVLVHRERLRFLQRLAAGAPLAGEPGKLLDRDARVLARALMSVEDEDLHRAADQLLDVTDLERLAQHVQQPLLWRRLLHHSAWRNLPQAARSEHLLAWSKSAQAATNQGRWAALEEVVKAFEGLPTEAQLAAGELPAPGEGSLWGDLLGDAPGALLLAQEAQAARLRRAQRPKTPVEVEPDRESAPTNSKDPEKVGG
ncbi:MAG: hypothetical protein ACI9HE_000550 [Planctomycetota bacterium]|jgi:hypothetical protein